LAVAVPQSAQAQARAETPDDLRVMCMALDEARRRTSCSVRC